MSNIIPFDSGKLPAYLAKANVAELNADLTSHAGGGFPVISIKGKVFAIVRDGERKVLPNPKDPDSPATSIDVVMLKANKGTSKVFYAKGYTEGAEGVKPDCFSNDGTKPDAGIEAPQSRTCATCKWNQWGSKIGENGSKGKACQDSVRMAIATPNLVNDPYLLRVPPASIRALGEYGQMLAKRNVAYNMVVTKIGFDMEAPTPKLTFKPVGMVDEETFNQIQEVAHSDTVAQILGAVVATQSELAAESDDVAEQAVAQAKTSSKVAVSKSKTVTDDEVKSAVQAAEKKPATTAKAADIDIDGLNLDDLNFDD
jgi:hypothetical protein